MLSLSTLRKFKKDKHGYRNRAPGKPPRHFFLKECSFNQPISKKKTRDKFWNLERAKHLLPSRQEGVNERGKGFSSR